jgi:2-keto-4-pentenoate hydratase/2-oxohepta-3-ene-1,7-dioic acid hydratase in catechol pathway
VHAVRFTIDGGEARIGRLEGDTVTDAGAAGPQGFVPTDEAWDALASASGATHALGAVRLLAPVVPRQILAIGLNYRAHAIESELAIPEVPVVFAMYPSSISGPHDEIVIPREETRTDYEGEVAVVISRRAYRVSVEDAWSYVGAVTALDDVSGRRAQLETPLRQFTLGKSFDTFTPIGPSLQRARGVDPTSISVRTTVSGEVMQDSTTADLIFPIAEIVEYLTRGITLEPGDLIATGTPGGVGDSRVPPRYLREGDVVEVEVGGVGSLRNPVRDERARAR